MKSFIIFSFLTCVCSVGYTQTNIAKLSPNRISIFKNGSYFVKKSGNFNLLDGKFLMDAPTSVLMGAYWLATSKDNPLKSIVVKNKVIKVKNTGQVQMADFSSYLNNNVALTSNVNKVTLSGTLLAFNPAINFAKLKTADGKIIFTDLQSYDQFIVNEDKPLVDSTIYLAEVQVSNAAATTTTATTLSLEKGMQWIPSYLLTIKNEKEAALQLKATIVNGSAEFLNTDVDIVVGNPEMFYKATLDPICINYLYNDVFERGDNAMSYGMSQLSNGGTGEVDYRRDDNEEQEMGGGTKLEDLFIYKLGKLSIEKNAKIIVPIASVDITYEDIYTTSIPHFNPENSSLPINVAHNYRLKNNTAAPFTTAPILVIDKTELPLAQAQLKYTPVKSVQDVFLANAIDVTVSNDEQELSTEKSTKKYNGSFVDKITSKGNVMLQNFQSKKIKVVVTKSVQGVVVKTSNEGKFKIFKSSEQLNSTTSTVTWEVELLANEKKEIAYEYYILQQ
jgi:hypothetical protein